MDESTKLTPDLVRGTGERLDKAVDIRTDGAFPLESVPNEQELERRQLLARSRMMGVLNARAEEVMKRHVEIALGEVVDDEGKKPDFMVQHLAAAILEKHVLGAPKQRIEQSSRSISFKANFDIPTAAIDPREQPERIDKPTRPQPRIPSPVTVKTIMASAPTASETIAKWKQGSIDAALAMPIDGYGTELPKEEK